MPRLSVNLNKIALLRNSRRTGVPEVLHFARLARRAGADGITVHPRPDQRYIRLDDVYALANLVSPWRPHFELNLEGYPDERFVSLCRNVKPEQCTIVPDPPTALRLSMTSPSCFNDERAEDFIALSLRCRAILQALAAPGCTLRTRVAMTALLTQRGMHGVPTTERLYADHLCRSSTQRINSGTSTPWMSRLTTRPCCPLRARTQWS